MEAAWGREYRRGRYFHKLGGYPAPQFRGNHDLIGHRTEKSSQVESAPAHHHDPAVPRDNPLNRGLREPHVLGDVDRLGHRPDVDQVMGHPFPFGR